MYVPHIEETSAVPYRLIGQEFGMALTPGKIFTVKPKTPRGYRRLRRKMAINVPDVGSTIFNHKNGVQVNLDVQHFAPEGISVRTAKGFVIVEGQHEEKEDERGLISRRFIRRYILPQDCDHNTVESKLSSDGVLTVIAPRMTPESSNGRNVPITHIGPVKEENQEGTAQQIGQTGGDANGTDKDK